MNRIRLNPAAIDNISRPFSHVNCSSIFAQYRKVNTMAGNKIEVTIYAGYRGAERPSSFVFEGRKVVVLGVVQMWVEEEHKTRKQRRFFTVKGSDTNTYTLYHDLETGEWFFRNRGKN